MISVIIPTYNREKKLLNSVNSVRNQTIRDIEIIVVDDGSTDSTFDVIKRIDDNRIKYIKLETNRGGGVARNIGVSKAKGEFIAFQDSDDIWYRNKLEVEIKALKDNKADIVFCKMNRIEDGKSTGLVPTAYKEGFLNPVKNVYGIGTPTLLGYSDIFKNNQFDSKFPRYQELELMIRLSEKYRIYCCDQALMDNYFDGGPDATSGNVDKLLTASRLLHNKYPVLWKKYGEMCSSISRTLLVQSYRGDIETNQKKEMRFTALRIDPRPKNIGRFIAVIFGIYPYLNKQAHETRNSSGE